MTTSEAIAKSILSSGDSSPDEIVANTMKFLEENNLEYFLPNILESLKDLSDRGGDSKTVFVYARSDVDNVMRSNILASLGLEENSKIEVVIDADLIGGILIMHNGKMYNASVKDRISKFKSALLR